MSEIYATTNDFTDTDAGLQSIGMELENDFELGSINRGGSSAECTEFNPERDVLPYIGFSSWTDGQLVASIRQDPPNAAAMDELATRYWKPLHARCRGLTLDHDKASDLAQDAWYRVFRARRGLKPDGNFCAYLMKVATNLWRDRHRSAQRAGPLAEHRLTSLDVAPANNGTETLPLAEAVADLGALSPEQAALLAMDLDNALAQLTPRQREILVTRYIAGESCAEIGQRFNRTEQTISGWIREALRIMKTYLEEVSFEPG